MTTAKPLTEPPASEDVQAHPGRRLTEDEFDRWVGEKTRAEWVDGDVVMKAPASIRHDSLGWWLRSVVQHFVDHHGLGTVCGSEVMVRLPKQRRKRVPDVSFVATGGKAVLLANRIEGPPDFIIEVVSPDSTARDWRDKYDEYQAAEVREYWVVDPLASRMEAYGLARGKKYRRITETDAGVPSIVLPGFRLEPAQVFAEPRPSVFEVVQKLCAP